MHGNFIIVPARRFYNKKTPIVLPGYLKREPLFMTIKMLKIKLVALALINR